MGGRLEMHTVYFMTYLVAGQWVLATWGHTSHIAYYDDLKTCQEAIQPFKDERPDVKFTGLKCVKYTAH
jgi:hypothetical protein